MQTPSPSEANLLVFGNLERRGYYVPTYLNVRKCDNNKMQSDARKNMLQ
jgi:hypothetical protein